jgi:hypothetical protein
MIRTKNTYIKNFLKHKSFAEVMASPYFSELKFKDRVKLMVRTYFNKKTK